LDVFEEVNGMMMATMV